MLNRTPSAIGGLVALCLFATACGAPTQQIVRETVEVTREVTVPPPATTAPTDVPGQPPTEPPTLAPTQPPTAPPPSPTPLVIVVVPIEGTPIMRIVFSDYTPAAATSLDFKVEARFGQADPDGTGIAEVIFEITDPNGETVYNRIERRSAFCAFGGGEPNCLVWVFAENNSKWPNGRPIESGEHQIQVTVRADPAFVDGGNSQWTSNNVSFNIQPPPPGPGLRAVITRPEPGDIHHSDSLVFQVEAFDPAVGASDGAGIAEVELLIIENPSGQVVHQVIERTPSYCAFGGNEPVCPAWDFAANNNQWPGGAPIADGTYILRAIVRAQSGQTATIETTIDVRLDD